VKFDIDAYIAMIKQMRKELADVGFKELITPEDVDEEMVNQAGTMLVVVNSVCGCAGGIARPGVVKSLQHDRHPDRLVTVFAGQERDATERMRQYFGELPPSSPSMFFFKDGNLVDVLHRSDIEGTSPDMVANRLTAMFDEFCKASV
jgi:putative YphP/YqiW family bacilliredoxin